MSRRVREFDRSDFHKSVVQGTAPHFHFGLPSGDEWKANRKLVNETMSTTFLTGTVGPVIYSNVSDIVDLWRQKLRLAEGRPFSAYDDIFKGALDIIFQTVFGVAVGSTKAQADFLANLSEIPLDSDADVAANLPAAKDPELFTAVMTITGTGEYVCAAWFCPCVRRFS